MDKVQDKVSTSTVDPKYGKGLKKESGCHNWCPASPRSPPPIDGAEKNDRIKTDWTRRDIGRSLETYPVNPVVRMAYPVIAVVYMVIYADVVKGNTIP